DLYVTGVQTCALPILLLHLCDERARVAVFPGQLPEIYSALEIQVGSNGDSRTLVAEVQQHLGDDRVRAVAMDATDGLARGVDVRSEERRVGEGVRYRG